MWIEVNLPLTFVTIRPLLLLHLGALFSAYLRSFSLPWFWWFFVSIILSFCDSSSFDESDSASCVCIRFKYCGFLWLCNHVYCWTIFPPCGSVTSNHFYLYLLWYIRIWSLFLRRSPRVRRNLLTKERWLEIRPDWRVCTPKSILAISSRPSCPRCSPGVDKHCVSCKNNGSREFTGKTRSGNWLLKIWKRSGPRWKSCSSIPWSSESVCVVWEPLLLV